MADDTTDRLWSGVGEFIRAQRELANLSLRQLADVAKISNPYLSQIERGIHKPSADVLKSLASALKISARRCMPRPGCSTGKEASACTPARSRRRSGSTRP